MDYMVKLMFRILFVGVVAIILISLIAGVGGREGD